MFYNLFEGMDGENHMNEIPVGPINAKEVVDSGTCYDTYKEDLGHHCGEQCHTHAYWSDYTVNIKYNACGGNGGNGGNGGDGGTASSLVVDISGTSPVNGKVIKNDGYSGIPGKEGKGTIGLETDRDYFGSKREEEDAGCNGFLGWDCDVHIAKITYHDYRTMSHDDACNGVDGHPGN